MDDNITSLSGKPGSPAAQAGQPVQMPVPSIQAVNQIIDEVVQSYIKAFAPANWQPPQVNPEKTEDVLLEKVGGQAVLGRQ